MLLLMIDIVTVSFAQSALNKSHKRIKRRLLILTIADQGNLFYPFYTGSQYTQHTLGIRRATVEDLYFSASPHKSPAGRR